MLLKKIADMAEENDRLRIENKYMKTMIAELNEMQGQKSAHVEALNDEIEALLEEMEEMQAKHDEELLEMKHRYEDDIMDNYRPVSRREEIGYRESDYVA